MVHHAVIEKVLSAPVEATVSAHLGMAALQAPEDYIGSHRHAGDMLRPGGVATVDSAPYMTNYGTGSCHAERDVRYGFEAAEHAMGNLVYGLTPGIREGRWQTILGDDASGRLPALVIGGVAKQWNAEHGLEKPAQLFIAGGRVKADELPAGQSVESAMAEKAEALSEYVEHVKSTITGRVLVVTEHVKRDGITMLARTLHDHGIPFDLAVVESRHTPETHMAGWRAQYPEAFEGVDMYVGQENMHYPVFKEEDALRAGAGVVRDSQGSVAAPMRHAQAHVNAARQEAIIMAQKLYSNIVQ